MEDNGQRDQVPDEGAVLEEEIQELAQKVEGETRKQPIRASGGEQKPSGLRRFLSSPVTALVLALVALILTVLNILGIPPFGFHGEKLAPAPVDQRLEATLRFAREEILAFRDENGRLPHDLEEINLEGAGDVEYQPLPDGGFRLKVQEGGQSLEATVPPAAPSKEGGAP